MTVVVDEETGDAGGPNEASPPPGRHSIWRRAAHAYLYGNQIVVTALAFVCALFVGAVLIVVTDPATRTSLGYFFQHPSDTLHNGGHAIAAAYTALFRGAILNPVSLYSNGGVPIFGPISDTLVNAAPLILGGLAVTVAFRAGLFNIGVQGQLIMGAIGAGYVGFAWHLPTGLHVLVAIIVGTFGGLLWGGLVGLLKAKTGAHEVVTTIMLNYVAYNFLGYLLGEQGFQAPHSHEATSSNIDKSAQLPMLFEDLHSGIILAILA